MNALRNLGFSPIDTQVYALLAKDGPHELREIALALNLQARKVSRSLKDLQSMRVVKATFKYPQEFVAVPFEEAIELLIEAKKEQARAIQQAKDELLSSWREVTKDNSEKS